MYYHGVVQDSYDSPMLRLLNHADMTTGPNGDYMPVQERITDIADRYGKGSSQEITALKLATRMLK